MPHTSIPARAGAELTTPHRILSLVSIHDQSMPLHIACMYHLKHLRSRLFIMAHEMVEREPENAMSWYAVGVWYLGKGKWSEARQYFRCVAGWSLLVFADGEQQNIADGPALRAGLGSLRAYICTGGRTRPCRDRVLDLRTHVQGVRS